MQAICPHCDSAFESARPKLFCSLQCYVSSDMFKANAAERKTGTIEACLQCGDEIYRIKSSKKKFCDKTCYRAYSAARFDRYAASHLELDTLNNYDEFLSKASLPCPVKDCGWEGQHLSMHMNHWHGIKAPDFKRMAGFNLTTGVITPSLRTHLQLTSTAAGTAKYVLAKCVRGTGKQNPTKSREAAENKLKARAGQVKVIDKTYPHSCDLCAVDFLASYPQHLRALKQQTIFCGTKCRQTYISHRRDTIERPPA